MQEEAKWYVVHTYSGYENKVANNIEKMIELKGWNNMIKEVRVPTQKIIEFKNNKQKESEMKLFPGYVFIKMILNDDSWYAVKNTRGITGFVGVDSKPAPLTEEEMLMFGKQNKQQIELDYSEGDTVTIINGPLEGYEAIVESLHKEKSVAKVLVSMFGRKTIVDVNFKDLKSFSK